MISLIPTRSSTIHESCQKYILYSIIYVSIITQSYPIKTDPSGIIKRLNHSTTSPSISLRLRGLAQARRARSGEPPPRLGESTKKTRAWQHGISLKRDPSRLGELPARSKIERAARATFRAKNLGELPVSSRLGEIDSLGRDLQVSSLFFTVTAMFSDQTTHAKHSYTSKRQIPPYIQHITHKPFKKRLKTITLTSRTWDSS